MAAKEMLAVARELLALKATHHEEEVVRRAVSTAYYSVFHLLTEAATGLYVSPGSPATGVLRRTLNHEPMKAVSGMFSKGNYPKVFQDVASKMPVSADLKVVAKAFVDLQIEREKADYEFGIKMERSEATLLIEKAEKAFEAWEKVKNTDEARLYLASFLLYKSAWNQDPRGTPTPPAPPPPPAGSPP